MKGFTLVELLIGFCIFMILIFAIFAVMDVARNAWFTGDVSVELRQDIIKAFLGMEKELKETRAAQISLSSDSTSSSLAFKIPQDMDGDGTILNSIGSIEWSNDITYALNAAKQITRTAEGLTTVLANNIISLQFTRPDSPLNLLQIDIAAQKTSVTRRTVQDSGQIIIKMRN